jgi:hypothetical protein
MKNFAPFYSALIGATGLILVWNFFRSGGGR